MISTCDTVDIEIYNTYGDGCWAQARFLVHGFSDVLWTNDLEAALNFLRADLEVEEKKSKGDNYGTDTVYI